MTVLRERIADNPQNVEGSFSRQHGTLRLCGEKQRFWSPCLDLTITAEDGESPERAREGQDTTKVWGTFSPRPEIWVGFVFAIGVCCVIAFLSSLFAIAQMMLGHPPWALWVPVATLLIAIGIYTSAIVGQGLSGDEMYQIRSYLDDCLSEAERRVRLSPTQRTDASSQL